LRTKSEIWVSAFLRAHFASGGFAAVLRRGAAEAGAIFVVHRKDTGASDLYSPAPQALFGAEDAGDRLFEIALQDADGPIIDKYLERQIRFDSDCWIVEFEGEPVPGLLKRAG
jgi:hypothetical protein